MNMTGKSVNELLEMNPNNLSDAELRQVVSRIASAGNKRLKRLEKSGLYSYASRYVNESGGKFSVRGKDRHDLMVEYLREKHFFALKSSSVREVKRIQKDAADKLRERGVNNINNEDIGKAFQLYDRLKERDPSVSIKGLKYLVINAIMEMPESLDFEDKILEMQEHLSDLYEDYDEIYSEFDGLSEFFDI